MNYSDEFFEKKSRELKATCIKLAHAGKEGHLNGALSSVDLLIALYYGFLNIDPRDPKHPERDRLLFSKGHACVSLYAILADRGFIPKSWLDRYASNDTPLPSHPCVHALPVLETSAGSLGHGMGIASGISYSLKMRNQSSRVVALISDGECNEGSTWESAMFANTHQLSNLTVIVDFNGIQSVGTTAQIMGSAHSVKDKFEAFGWDAILANGHDIPELIGLLNRTNDHKAKPKAIIAQTVAGSGVSFMENQVLWHYRVPSAEDVSRAMVELGQA